MQVIRGPRARRELMGPLNKRCMKMKFSINDWVTFTAEIFNGELPLLCSETSMYFSWINLYNLNTPNTSLNRVSLHIQSEYVKIRTRKNSVFGHF